MKITQVKLKNIKSFHGECSFDLSGTTQINTISGVNGSGKSTLFKSIVLAQRIFFERQVNSEKNDELIQIELSNFFTSKDSSISIKFEVVKNDEVKEVQFSVKCSCINKDKAQYEFVATSEDIRLIEEYWSISNPKKLIVYVESNKRISEADYTHESIALKATTGNELALEYIYRPESIFESIYERLIKDYIRERLIPNKPRRDLPFVAAKVFTHHLLPYLTVSNFTGIEKDNQFILQVKSDASRDRRVGGSMYDARSLSSGEKALFYIFYFVCSIPNIGMLIIDEPENNLHENLLNDFVRLLNEICQKPDFGSLICEIAIANNEKLGQAVPSQLKASYRNQNLSQVYLLTHSKNLIYNNFSVGNNYVMKGGLVPIEYDNCEEVFRSIGLSRVYSKILFVEGETDNQLLEKVLSPYNIKIKPLGGASEVIDTFKKLSRVYVELRDVNFCFLIDRDTRNDNDILTLRAKDESRFEKHFIILDRHEFENYFLDASIYLDLYGRHSSLFPELTSPSLEEIQQSIKSIADSQKQRVVKKYLQNLNQKSFGSLKVATSGKDLPVDSEANYEGYIENALRDDSIAGVREILKANYSVAMQAVSEWEDKWISLCDGKVVFNSYVNTLVQSFGVNQKRLVKEVVQIALQERGSSASSVVNEILRRFN
jgi:AAA15 family ATPase/GTPase